MAGEAPRGVSFKYYERMPALMGAHTGELVAVMTSVLWTMSSLLFTFAGREQHPRIVNRVRILLAMFVLGALNLVIVGSLIPDATGKEWALLAASGVVGLAVGDAMLFRAFVEIGPRLSMLIMALGPVVTTVVAWLLLGEALPWLKVAAIVFAISGVAIAVTAKEEKGQPFKVTAKGVFLATGGMLGQAGGLLLAKDVMDSGFEPLTATYIRIMAGAAALWFVAIFAGEAALTYRATRDTKFRKYIAGAVIFGPVLGIWSMMYALGHAPIGIASTLTSLSPLFLVPLSALFFGERLSGRAVLGALVTMVGVAGIFLI